MFAEWSGSCTGFVVCVGMSVQNKDCDIPLEVLGMFWISPLEPGIKYRQCAVLY